jgi:hypothetical protein
MLLFFFFFAFDRAALIANLSRIVTNRESLNEHVRNLQRRLRRLPERQPDAERGAQVSSKTGNDLVSTDIGWLTSTADPLPDEDEFVQGVFLDGWPVEDIEEVLEHGLQALPDKRLVWLENNPVALFRLYNAINELLPDAWLGLVLEDAKQLWDARPSAARRSENK